MFEAIEKLFQIFVIKYLILNLFALKSYSFANLLMFDVESIDIIINIFQNKIFIQLNKRSLWRSCNISYLKCIRIIFCPITRCLKVKRLLKFAVLCTMCKPYKFVSFPVNHSSVALKIKAWPSILCVYPGIWKCLYSFCFIYRFSVSNIIKSIASNYAINFFKC